MKAEELAMIINEIDEDMVEDAWTENGTTIIISESRPLSFWKIAVTAAACFAAVIAGVFCFTRLKPGDTVSPNNSTYSNSSFGESNIDIPPGFEDNIILFDEAHTDKVFFAKKSNDNNFAMLNIEETNATVENPVLLTVCGEDGSSVSATVRIIGSGRYGVYYKHHRSTGDTCRLTIGNMPDGLVLKGTWTS